jgi:hypothetical protein
MDWFGEQYDSTCRATPVMLHRTNSLHAKASARDGMRVITFEKLSKLREAVDGFAQALTDDAGWKDSSAVAERLASFQLTGSLFLNAWALPARK